MRLANASVSTDTGMQVRVFLMGDSVTAAKKGQVTSEGYYNIGKMLLELAAKGVEVRSCGACMKARGIGDSDLIDCVQRGTMMNLASWVKESDKIVTF